MKAITFKNYGSPEVLHYSDVEKPTSKDNEVLIKINSTAVNIGDVRLRKADPWAVRLFLGLTKPKINILGAVFSGEIESIGKDVKSYKIGDQIFGTTGMTFGSYAEYMSLPETATMTIKPKSLTHNEAAVIPFGGTTALHFIKKAKIQKSQKVLIYGASGSVGTTAIQLAKYYGADVTGVCSTSNIDLVRSLGADNVIDYTKEDFTKNGIKYDVIFDTVGKSSISKNLKSLNKTGTLLLGAAMLPGMIQSIWSSITSSKKVVSGVISEKAADMEFLKELVESGNLKPVIDRTYSFEQIPEAHEYVEKGHKKGNVAIQVVDL